MQTSMRVRDVAQLAGRSLGTTDWFIVSQEMVDAFADATDDHQWIHVDPARAQAGPFKTTIAHGYLTLALVPRLVRELLVLDDLRMAVNYGVNRCRFPRPVLVGSTLHGEVTVVEAVPAADDAAKVTFRVTVTAEGDAKPACVAEVVTLYYPQ